jgi:diaminopimelate decarboxylase
MANARRCHNNIYTFVGKLGSSRDHMINARTSSRASKVGELATVSDIIAFVTGVSCQFFSYRGVLVVIHPLG